jgi:hypothetical protein
MPDNITPHDLIFNFQASIGGGDSQLVSFLFPLRTEAGEEIRAQNTAIVYTERELSAEVPVIQQSRFFVTTFNVETED